MVAQLTAQGVEMPSRVGLVPGGMVAFDGDQLTINLTGITRGFPGRPDGTALNPTLTKMFYDWDITLIRTVSTVSGQGPDGGIPTQEDLTADFDNLVPDAVALWNALIAIHVEALIVPINVDFMYGPMTTIGPEGDMAGVRMPVSFQAGFAVNGTY